MNIERGIKKLDALFKARPESEPHISDLELGFEDLREILLAMNDEPAPAEKECERKVIVDGYGTEGKLYCKECGFEVKKPDTITISREVAERWIRDYGYHATRPMSGFNLLKEFCKSLAVERNVK